MTQKELEAKVAALEATVAVLRAELDVVPEIVGKRMDAARLARLTAEATLRADVVAGRTKLESLADDQVRTVLSCLDRDQVLALARTVKRVARVLDAVPEHVAAWVRVGMAPPVAMVCVTLGPLVDHPSLLVEAVAEEHPTLVIHRRGRHVAVATAWSTRLEQDKALAELVAAGHLVVREMTDVEARDRAVAEWLAVDPSLRPPLPEVRA